MLAATSRTTRFGVSFCSFIFPPFELIPGVCGSSMGTVGSKRAHTSGVLASPPSTVPRGGTKVGILIVGGLAGRQDAEPARYADKDTTTPTAAQMLALCPPSYFFQPIIGFWPEMCSNGPPPESWESFGAKPFGLAQSPTKYQALLTTAL